MKTNLQERRAAARRLRAMKPEGDLGWGYRVKKLYGKETVELLTLHEAIANPQLGCPVVVVAELRGELSDKGLIRTLKALASDYADLSGFERRTPDEFGRDGSTERFVELTYSVAGRKELAEIFEKSIIEEIE